MEETMKFGICDPDLKRIPSLVGTGVEYVELAVSSNLTPLATDAEWEPVRKEIMALPFKAEAFNLFYPGNMRITGPDVNWELVEKYASKAIERCAKVGGQVMVIGSGGARQVPEGFSWDEAWGQLRQMFKLLGPIAGKWGVTIVSEPLRKQECNILNLVSEGVRMAREVNHPNIKTLADFYHIDELGEPLQHIIDAGPYLAHVHVADTGRWRPGSGSYDYPTFFKNLKKIGYDAHISMEGRWNYDKYAEEASAGIKFMREVWKKA
jgi:sugar phosphate isomerase/epimerase